MNELKVQGDLVAYKLWRQVWFGKNKQPTNKERIEFINIWNNTMAEKTTGDTHVKYRPI